MDRYSKFKNTISHKVHELKSSAANVMIKEGKIQLKARCNQSFEFYFHGKSKLGDHASFCGTLMHCNLP